MPKVQTPPNFIDPITDELMRDPVVTADGHTYERSAIVKWLQENNTSPNTNLPLSSKNLVPNLLAKKSIEEFKEKNNLCTEEEFFKAVATGDPREVEKLNYLDLYLEAKDKNGWTPLHHAITKKHFEMVKFLLINGASANTSDENEDTPLHNAALENDFKVIQLLLAFGAKPNTKNRHSLTPLHLAALNRNVEAMDQLLANNEAALEIKDKNDWTALHCAAAGGSNEAVVLLLKRGANPGAKNNKGLTPSAVVREERNFAMANLIEDYQSKLEDKKKIIELRKVISNQQEKIEIYAAERHRDAAKIKQLEEENRKLKEPQRANYSNNPYMNERYEALHKQYQNQNYPNSDSAFLKSNKP